MKKIGIMSMQRILNYGSFLQAYGLKNEIERLGYQVEFVDYEYEPPIDLNKVEKVNFIKRIIRNLNIFKFLQKKISMYMFNKKYLEALNDIGINSEKNIRPELDCLIIGSDEVFNCIQGYPVGYSRELFGYNYEKVPVISYAGSFGYTKISDLKKYKIDKEIGNFFNNMKAISVRDENSKKIVEELTGIEPFLHLDPVLITKINKKNNTKIKYSNFILIYAYPGRLTKEEEKYIKLFAKRNHKKIISVGFYQKIANHNIIVSPLEVLDYFEKADYVITDTFHGTIFSVRMKTKFCTIIRESNKNKLGFLLKKLKQEKRMVQNIKDIEKLYKEDIDFTETNKILEEERIKSINYLKEYIG